LYSYLNRKVPEKMLRIKERVESNEIFGAEGPNPDREPEVFR
jgi:hypothetical protein